MGSLSATSSIPKLNTVAIIGFGVSGIVSAIHLKAAGLDVTVYERSSKAGGVWLYDNRLPLEPRYPAIRPSVAELEVWDDDNTEHDERGKPNDQHSISDDETFEISIEKAEYEKLMHAPPGPAYKGLKNNVPTSLMELKGLPWNPGTADYVNHTVIVEYLQSAAKQKDVDRDVIYDTRVEHVWKEKDTWFVRSTTLLSTGNESVKKVKRVKKFDAIVVASGHYNAPRIPDVPGLREWKKRWPSRVMHSKSYRDPNKFKNQTVLLVGGSTSSMDIARELEPFASRIYQSCRGGLLDVPESFLPPGARRVGEIMSFESISPNFEQVEPSEPSDPVLGVVTLKDGTTLKGIQRVIVATGYQHTLPFLPALHDDTIPAYDADDTQLITEDGTQVHNLHRDIFYIPDPTLAFIGIPYFTATFTLFEYQAMALAAVFARRAKLPSAEDMRTEYRAKVERKGFGKIFHSLWGEEVAYVDDLVAWVNRDRAMTGADGMEGHPEKWRELRAIFDVKAKERLGADGYEARRRPLAKSNGEILG